MLVPVIRSFGSFLPKDEDVAVDAVFYGIA
jgi:hypothetical protein